MELIAKHPVAVLGAGPVGLAAAAHLIEYGITPLVFEADDAVAASFRDFGHVRLFSPWRYNVDRASRTLLEARGWGMPDADANPTAGELLRDYLEPLAALPAIAASLKLGSRVVAVARQGYDKVKSEGRERAPFVIRVEEAGELREYLAGAVIDATGNWSGPNPLGANGLPAIGEARLAHRIRYGMPDVAGDLRSRYLGRTTLVVGAGHSAVGSLVALAELSEADPATTIHWALRGGSPARVFGGGEADQLPARGALGLRLRELVEGGRLVVHSHFRIRELVDENGAVTVLPEDGFGGGAEPIRGVDEIIGATGSRPDLDLVRELRVRTDAWLESTEALAPLIDPNLHSCGTVRPHGHRELAHPEPGFYIVGAKSYGRAPTFLLATGYEQARSVVAALAGDLAAADDVRLDLPETGVCVTDFAGAGAGGCCGEAPAQATVKPAAGCCTPSPAAACCA
jgi:hypothetical protein